MDDYLVVPERVDEQGQGSVNRQVVVFEQSEPGLSFTLEVPVDT